MKHRTDPTLVEVYVPATNSDGKPILRLNATALADEADGESDEDKDAGPDGRPRK
jgi:hypothetical protein